MPRAFDQRQIAVDRNPLLNFADLPSLPAYDPAAAFAGMLGTCTNPFIGGLGDLGTGTTEIGKIGTGLQAFIDGLLGPLLTGALANLTPQQILNFVDAIRSALLDNVFVTGILDLIGGISDNGILNDLVGGFQQFTDTLLGGLGFSDWSDIITAITDFFGWLFNELGMGVEAVLKPVAEFLNWLFTGLATGAAPPSTGNTAADALLAPLFGFLKWVWDLFGNTVNTVLKPIFTFLHWLFDGFATGATPPSTGNTAADSILQPLFGFLRWLWQSFGATVDTVLKPIFTFLHWLIGTLFAGSTTALQNIFTALHGLLDGSQTLGTWLAGIPSLTQEVINTLWSALNGGAVAINKTINDVLTSIGVFVSNLIPALTGNPLAQAIGDVTTWAANLLNKGLTWPDFKTLFGEIPSTILGVIPVPHISYVNPELMTQGGFDSASTLAAGNGWTWDSTTTHSGSGGSAKVTGTGAGKTLYSNQSINVAAGDKLIISCYVKSSGSVSSGAIQIRVVEFNGTTQGTTTVVGSTGGTSTWTQIGSTAVSPYTVSGTATSVRIGVGITSGAASGSTVWFDDISVRKTGLLSGDWMAGILGTVTQDFQAITDKIIQAIKGAIPGGTGNALGGIFTALQSIFTTLFNTLALPTNLTSTPLLANAIPGLNTSKITEGRFSSDFIGENAVGTYQIAPDAVGTSEIATDAVGTNEIAPDAVGTSEISTGAVTGGATGELAQNTITSNNVTEIDGTKIKSGTINVDRLPSTLTAVGSGFHITKNVNAAAYTTVLNGSGTSGTVNFMPYSFYDLTSSQIAGSTITPDITINNVSGNLCATISNAGWYLVQVSFVLVGGIYPGQFNYRWGFTPGIVKSTVSSLPAANFFRAGPTAVPTVDYNVNASSSWAPDVAHGSWVVYLNANESLYPSYYCTREGSGMFTDTIIKNGLTGFGGANLTSFSIALLNRSLA